MVCTCSRGPFLSDFFSTGNQVILHITVLRVQTEKLFSKKRNQSIKSRPFSKNPLIFPGEATGRAACRIHYQPSYTTSTNCHTQAPRCLASIQHKLADFKLIIMSATLQGGLGFTLQVKDEGESVCWNGKSYCWGVSARKLIQHWIHWCIMMHYDA